MLIIERFLFILLYFIITFLFSLSFFNAFLMHFDILFSLHFGYEDKVFFCFAFKCFQNV